MEHRNELRSTLTYTVRFAIAEPRVRYAHRFQIGRIAATLVLAARGHLWTALLVLVVFAVSVTIANFAHPNALIGRQTGEHAFRTMLALLTSSPVLG